MLPSRVRRAVAARWGESTISPASIYGPAGWGGDGGGRSAWWSASSGREDPCFVAVALHAALIGGRLYRVVFFRRCGYQLFRFLEPTTGWVLLSGAEQARSPIRSTPRSPTPSSPLSDHDAGTTSRRVRRTLDPRARMPGPARRDRVLGPTGDGAVNVNSTSASPVPVTDEFTPRLA